MFGPALKGPSEGGEVSVNNNENKSPAFGEHMNNTVQKTEERSFQEERRDVMKMNKMFAGLIAFVAGVALSAGSAFATNGYMTGDSAMMKLVPYFETGANRATLIAVQNMSSQEQNTMNKNADVTNIQSFLDGMTLGGSSPTADQTRAIGLINDEFEGTNIDGEDELDAGELNLKAAAEKALEKANMAKYTEHVFVTVNVYNAVGMMMEGASANLCLAENQFGYVILQGPGMQDWQMEIPNQGMILTVMDGDIPEYGYVKVMAGGTKYQACSSATPAGIMRVDTRPTGTTPGQLEEDDGDPVYTGATSRVATWAIVQDTGMGFFGTEVPTATVSMNMKVGDSDMADVACYTTPAQTTGDDDRIANAMLMGAFMPSRCGLIPERHRNVRDSDGVPDITDANEDARATPLAHAFARYDAMDDSMIYVWLADGMDTDTTLPKERRMLDVTVMCMDGSMPPGPDRDGDNQPDSIMVAAPNMLTMIDPADMDGLGMYTDMCADSRGVLKIKMPNNSRAGMVFTHISQMGNSYRMNFQGYSLASPDDCANDDACM